MAGVELQVRNAGALVNAGRFQEAEALCRQILRSDPQNGPAYSILGTIAALQKDYPIAIAHLERAVTLYPGNLNAYLNLGICLNSTGEFQRAVEVLKKSQKVARHSECYNNLGMAYKNLNRIDKAIRAYREALKLDPANVNARKNLASTLIASGDIEQARRQLEKVVELKPGHAAALFLLADLTRFKSADDPLMARLQETLAAGVAPTDDRALLHLALFKAYDDLGLADQAFSHLEQGNGLRRQTYNYDIDLEARKFREIAAVFSEKMIAAMPLADAAVREPRPIFVIGMPRSGSTLLEQILSSHPQIGGIGETECLTKALFSSASGLTVNGYPAKVPRLDRDRMASIAAHYLELVRAHGVRDSVFVDKNLKNFAFAGLIRLLFPDAVILHCRRDPVATCFSCYRHNFGGVFPYTYDLRELGIYYSLYDTLMKHWHRVFPGAIYDVCYEDLVDDPETVIRGVLQHCGVGWNRACLDFHRSGRAVKTSSNLQVRNPIYKTREKAWHRYRERLEPLLTVLEENRLL